MFPYYGIGALGDVRTYMTFERDGIWISYIHRDWIPQLRAWYRDSLLHQGCSSIICMFIRAFSSYSLRYLVSEVKVNLFHVWVRGNVKIFVHEWCLNLPQLMLLKLIHFKSFNSEVTWSRFKYFPFLNHFCGKVDSLVHYILQFFTAFTPYWTTIV